MSNTTISRPSHLRSASKEEGGGLSGRPLTKLATETIRDMYRLTKGKVRRSVKEAAVPCCLEQALRENIENMSGPRGGGRREDMLLIVDVQIFKALLCFSRCSHLPFYFTATTLLMCTHAPAQSLFISLTAVVMIVVLGPADRRGRGGHRTTGV